MSRLIDADKLMEYVQNLKSKMIGCNEIARFPTAYNIDKVIEQLEELEKEHPYRVIGQPNTYSQYNQGWCDCIDRVIGIVKKGGAE